MLARIFLSNDPLKVDDYSHFFLSLFQEIKIVSILMKTFLWLTPRLSA